MRKDFLILNQQIKEVYREYIQEHKQIPTQTQVAETCGVSPITISRHFSKIDLSELVKPFKIYGDDILMGLRQKASKGDAQAAKLFFMLVYDWNEKLEHEIKDPIEMIIRVRYEDEDKTKA